MHLCNYIYLHRKAGFQVMQLGYSVIKLRLQLGVPIVSQQITNTTGIHKDGVRSLDLLSDRTCSITFLVEFVSALPQRELQNERLFMLVLQEIDSFLFLPCLNLCSITFVFGKTSYINLEQNFQVLKVEIGIQGKTSE